MGLGSACGWQQGSILTWQRAHWPWPWTQMMDEGTPQAGQRGAQGGGVGEVGGGMGDCQRLEEGIGTAGSES